MKKILTLLFSLLIVFTCTTQVFANDKKIIDEANVLSDAEETQINSLIINYINKTNFDIVVYFTEYNDYFNKYSNEDDAITNLADDTFDYNGYGLGSDHNGLIMVVDIGYRNYTITTRGDACIDTYTDNALDSMYEEISYALSNYGWADGAEEFIDQAQRVYDNYDYYHQKANPMMEALAPAFIGSLVITLISFFVLRGQLKHMAVSTTAASYMSNHKINISRSGDIYLYTNVSRQRIQRNPPSSSGSSTHISSSGASHGGGGSHHF